MLFPTKIYFLVFGILTIAGGVMGYVKAGSTASIIAGAIGGLLLLLAGFLLPNQLIIGLTIGVVVSLLLAGRFVPAFFRTGKLIPDGIMALLSVIAIVFAIIAWMRK